MGDVNNDVRNSRAASAGAGSVVGVLALVEELEAVVEQLTAVDPRAMDGGLAMEVSPRLRAVVDRLGAQRLGLIGQIDADGLWASEPVRTVAHWLASRERVSLGSARRDVRTARVLRDHLTATAEAGRAGVVTPEQVGIVVGIAATSQARLEALTAVVDSDEAVAESSVDANEPTRPRRGEDVLLGLAGRHSLRDFTRIARRFAVVADPESDERGYRLASEREHLDLSPTIGGYHVQGFLAEEHGQLVRTALGAVMGTAEPGCTQSPAKRRAVALAGLARQALDEGRFRSTNEQGPAGDRLAEGARAVGEDSWGARDGSARDGSPAVRPHLTVTVSWTELTHLLGANTAARADAIPATSATEDLHAMNAQEWQHLLESPPATWSDGRGPVPPEVLKRIAADCALTRVIFGPESQILDVGRAQRTFTGPRRKAIIARDQHCVWPGCHEPPEHAQIHHARVHWADGGRTSTDNAALLCWYHHDHVDTRRIAMTFTNGRWHFDTPGSYGERARQAS
ncbi:hypothetical protein GCM10011331_09860 [Flavimobilis marinus]|nr:HNH endonuclease signature motif containing protein [Flavimobilis marinus]GHG48250.1 hypothetical protein GCM10011331_09860 [Flavimobilis marinus]